MRQFRPMGRTEHGLQVLDIERQTYCESDQYKEDDLCEILGVNPRTLRQEATAIVAVEGSRVIGYAIWRHDGCVISLLRLVVHPGFYGQGVGRALMGRIKRVARAQRMCLNAIVPAANQKAERFLLNSGFALTACIESSHDVLRNMYSYSPGIGERLPPLSRENRVKMFFEKA